MAKISDYLSEQGAGYQISTSVPAAHAQEMADALEVLKRDQPGRTKSALVRAAIIAQAERVSSGIHNQG